MDLLQGMHIKSSQEPSKVTISFTISMKHIFDVCEEHDKFVYGLKHSLTVVRKTDVDAIFRAAAAGAGKVSLDNILSWFMLHIIPPDAEKFSIYKNIKSKVKAPVV